jgi:protein SCO1/2
VAVEARIVSTRAKLALVVVLSFALSIAIVAFRHRASAKAPLPVLAHIDGFSLYDQRGKSVRLDDLGGKVWIADFIFTGCQAACPMLTSRMRSLQRHLEEREAKLGRQLPVRLVSFSVDPEVDTPEKLLAYAAKWGADERRWLFLTGSLEEMNRAVTRGMKIPFEKGGADTSAFDVMHGERLVVVDESGRIRGYFDTDPEGMERVKEAIESLLADRGA